MKNLLLLDLPHIIGPQVREWFGIDASADFGVFAIKSPIDGAEMHVIAQRGCGWDHVSVSRKKRSPNQTELSHIHRLFFEANETAVQYFLPADQHVDNHGTCLHLWRPAEDAMPTPPPELVGVGKDKPTSPHHARAIAEEGLRRLKERGFNRYGDRV